MLGALLAKDLRRARRNPLPWLINLALPLCITGLIGLAFGGKSDTQLGRIRFAVVDEDKTTLTGLLHGAMNQEDAGKYLEPVFLDRAEALKQINADQISAVLIIPTNFTRHYLLGGAAVKLELIKNPARSIHPTVLEELLEVVVTGLNAVARNFKSEFPDWRAAFEGDLDYHKISTLIERAGNKLEVVRKYVKPPLVVYQTHSDEDEAGVDPSSVAGAKSDPAAGPGTATPQAAKGSSKETKTPPKPGGKTKADTKSTGNDASPIFAFLLLGMTAMFLLFIAGTAMSDLYRELRFRTLERYQTLREQLLPFVSGKVIYGVVLLLFCSLVMLGGGGLVFRIPWKQPLALVTLTFAYTCFAAGLMALFVAVMPDERRAGVLTNIVGMALGMGGGCAFPPEQLPRFMREHITPLLPTHWFVQTARALQFGANDPWIFVSLKLALLSAVLVGLAVWLFRRRLRAGLRA